MVERAVWGRGKRPRRRRSGRSGAIAGVALSVVWVGFWVLTSLMPTAGSHKDMLNVQGKVRENYGGHQSFSSPSRPHRRSVSGWWGSVVERFFSGGR